jgi:hypothetical protein
MKKCVVLKQNPIFEYDRIQIAIPLLRLRFSTIFGRDRTARPNSLTNAGKPQFSREMTASAAQHDFSDTTSLVARRCSTSATEIG